MPDLTPEERQKIYEEEKTRKEAQEQFKKEDRQKKLNEAYNKTKSANRKKIIECKNCGYIGLPTNSYNRTVGFLLFLFFIVPWLIYEAATHKNKCPNCGSKNLIKIRWV
jgi:DNA-directed RNA polymerase subunit RPC12/RpoP